MNEITTSDSLVDLAARIRSEHDKVCHSVRASVDHALRVGSLLLEAKKLVDHGGWIEWVERHCNLSERSAQAYMRIARHPPNPQLSADLTIDATLKALAKPKLDQPTSMLPPTTSTMPVNKPAARARVFKRTTEAVFVATDPAKARSNSGAGLPLTPEPQTLQSVDLISQCVSDVRARIVETIDQLDQSDWSVLTERLHSAIEDLLDQPSLAKRPQQQEVDDLDVPEFLRRRAP